MVYRHLRKGKSRLDAWFNPVAIRLHLWGVRPGHLTAVSLASGLAGAYLLFDNLLAIPLLVVYFILDVADGLLARAIAKSTEHGRWLDFTADRLVVTALLYKYYIHSNDAFLTTVLLAGVLIVSLVELLEKKS